jgi:fructose-specific PTS system IIA-like component
MELFARNHVLGTVEASAQEDVFSALANKAVELGVAKDAAAIVADYEEREREATTGFGGGVAIPHSKTDNVSDATLLFARLSQPVEWQALDGAPVSTVISILAPTAGADVHLQLLAKLARKLMHADFVEVLKNGTFDEAYAAIQGAIS